MCWILPDSGFTFALQGIVTSGRKYHKEGRVALSMDFPEAVIAFANSYLVPEHLTAGELNTNKYLENQGVGCSTHHRW